MENFLETIILKKNPCINAEDLKIIGKISSEYNVVNYIESILNDGICKILSWAIINELPFRVADKLLYNHQLMSPIVAKHGDRFVSDVKLKNDQEYIDFHIQRINKLINAS